MSNGPMGGFMPTPAAPAQPPTVKLDTTALSRGNFNNFLKNMSGASSLNPPMAPQMGAMMSPSLAPSVSDIDIFNQPMQMMQQGGNVAPRQTEIMGQPHMLAYITPQEGNILEGLGGANEPGPMGIPSFFDAGEGMGGYGGGDSATDDNDDDNNNDSGGSFSDDAQATDPGGQGGFSDDAQATDPGVGGGDDNNDNQESIVGDDPVAGIGFTPGTVVGGGSFDVVDPPTVTSDEQQQNIFDAQNFITGTTQFPSAQNFGSRIPNISGNLLEDIKKNINLDNEKVISEDDALFNRDGSITPAGQAELNKMNAETLNLVTSGEIPASRFTSATTSGDILGEKDIQDALSLKEIDPFDIQPTFQNFGLPGVSGLPTVKSTRSTVAEDQARALANLVGDKTPTIGEQLQQNILEERGRALGPTTFSDDLQNFAQNERSRGFDEISRVGDDQLAIDEAERAAKGASTVGDDFQTALDLVDARQKALTARDANVRDMDDIDIATAGRASDFPTVSTMPEDFEENVGLPFDAKRMADIERLYGVNPGQAGYGTGPISNFRDTSKFQDGQDPTFLEGLGLPSLFSAFDPERRSRDLMATEVALGRPMTLGETIFGFDAPNIGMGKTKATDQETIQQYNERTGRSIPENQLVRNDSGRIIAIKDKFGRTVSGVDPNEKIQGGDDSGSPIIRPTVPRKEEEDKPSTNIGMMGGANPFLPSQSPVIVDSPFTTSVGDFQGTGFSTGDLNRLIAELTGIKSPRSMAKGGVAKFANGGLIKAVDDFLSTGQ
jgi:uncharacterized protein YciI